MAEICACVLAKSYHNNASWPYLSMKSSFPFPTCKMIFNFNLLTKGSHLILTVELWHTVDLCHWQRMHLLLAESSSPLHFSNSLCKSLVIKTEKGDAQCSKPPNQGTLKKRRRKLAVRRSLNFSKFFCYVLEQSPNAFTTAWSQAISWQLRSIV